jgi:hypothetical protein
MSRRLVGALVPGGGAEAFFSGTNNFLAVCNSTVCPEAPGPTKKFIIEAGGWSFDRLIRSSCLRCDGFDPEKLELGAIEFGTSSWYIMPIFNGCLAQAQIS